MHAPDKYQRQINVGDSVVYMCSAGINKNGIRLGIVTDISSNNVSSLFCINIKSVDSGRIISRWSSSVILCEPYKK